MQTLDHSENRAQAVDFPAALAQQILAADVIILIGSSETNDNALTVKQVYASGEADPEHVASHAYAHAALQAHPDLLRTVRGEPTDAHRYRALRDFAMLATTDKPRFEAVNSMLHQFEEETGVPDEDKRVAADHDAVADFLAQALIETEYVMVETPAPALELPVRLVLPN